MVLALEHKAMLTELFNSMVASSTISEHMATKDAKSIETTVHNKGAGGDLHFKAGETITLSLDDWIRASGIEVLWYISESEVDFQTPRE